MCKNLRKFKIKVQFFCSVSQANTMKNTAEVCPSGRRGAKPPKSVTKKINWQCIK